jgi:hypothetical protein
MSGLMRMVAPPLAFLAVLVLAPGFAGARDSLPASPTCAPVPSCLPVPDLEDQTSAVDEPIATANDTTDDLAVTWFNCTIQHQTLIAFHAIDDPNNRTPGVTPVYPGECKVMAAGGTTFYKHYGVQPDSSAGYFASGGYGKKFDHEEHAVHCGGGGDSDCQQHVYMTSKFGKRVFADNICPGLGFCPNASFQSHPKGRPFCGIQATFHQDKVRNECWYVH